ncbi:MAG: indolepyruvate oxidoreductase subunit beta [Treponema sp.]|jgi:indolepyruvate ferredoxin oxidoreductase beta subunit|nr:indolepyruvate oxidoreductase subunit beta [Treponema sp.]
MKKDIILAGVGGQGALTVAAVIAHAAAAAGFSVRQGEVHGMAQRGGAVLAHLRLSDSVIASDLGPQGSADLILSMEPLESLRYAPWLSPQGVLISAGEPFVNIGDYPDLAAVLKAIAAFPLNRIVYAEALAKEAGLSRTANMVMVGAASPFLPIPKEILENTITAMFAGKGTENANIRAFNLGRGEASK